MEGVKTAAAFLLTERKLVLTVEMPDKWLSGAVRVGLPGGKVESGETRYMAAIRECQEEVSVTPHFISAPRTFALLDGVVVDSNGCYEDDVPGEPRPLTRQRVTKNGWNINGAGYLGMSFTGTLAAGDVLAVLLLALDKLPDLKPQGEIHHLLTQTEVAAAKENFQSILAPTYSLTPGLLAVRNNGEIMGVLRGVS